MKGRKRQRGGEIQETGETQRRLSPLKRDGEEGGVWWWGERNEGTNRTKRNEKGSRDQKNKGTKRDQKG